MDKVCLGCRAVKPLTEYYLDRGKPVARCKMCVNARNALWRNNNRDAKKAMDTAWQRNNRQRYRANQRLWRDTNPERMPIYRKMWLEKNLEFAKISHRNAENRRRAQKYACGGSIDTNAWLEVVKSFNDHCAYCLSTLNNSYHMEHMKPLSRGGSHTIDNVVPACPACNLKKSSKTLIEFVSQVVEMR